MKKGIVSGVAIGVLAILASLIVLLPKLSVNNDSRSFGSIIDGQGYNSTTTRTGIVATGYDLESNQGNGPNSGILGSIIITASSSGQINLYDATTSNVSLRTGQRATSSLLLANIDAWAPPGTYVFDTVFRHGLLLVTGGTLGTTTITWK